MATQRFRHANSPEELAKREAEGPREPAKRKEFRHWNSPEERAARGEAPLPASPAAVVPRAPRRPQRSEPLEDWPPKGQSNNAPAGPPQARRAPPDTSGQSLEQRVEQLEGILYVLLDDPADARRIRMLLNNIDAVTESQRDFNARLIALEHELEDMAAEDNGDEGPEAPDAEDAPAAPAAATTEGNP